MRLGTTVIWAGVFLAACGGSTSTGGDGGGGADSGNPGGDGGCGASCIPDPGTSDAVDQNWGDVEPNNTPSQATPLGTALSGDISSWVNSNAIGGTDSSDYFVFRTSPDAGSLSFNFCFTSPITAINATLWQVSAGVQQVPPVATWASSATCVTNTGALTPLQGSTVYLFGLTATGGSGTYSA